MAQDAIPGAEMSQNSLFGVHLLGHPHCLFYSAVVLSHSVRVPLIVEGALVNQQIALFAFLNEAVVGPAVARKNKFERPEAFLARACPVYV